MIPFYLKFSDCPFIIPAVKLNIKLLNSSFKTLIQFHRFILDISWLNC